MSCDYSPIGVLDSNKNTNKQTISNADQIFVFNYLTDLTDPQHSVNKYIENLGYFDNSFIS